MVNRFHALSRKRFLSLPLILCLAPQNTAVQPAAIFRHGVQAMQNGQLNVAERDFQTVIALDPRSGAAHINLAVAYMREKRWDEALAELHIAQSLSPQEPGIPLNIGLAHYKKNEYSDAIAPFSASLKLAPQSVQARYLLGLCYFFTRQYKLAADTLTPLWEKESRNPNYLYVLTIAAGKCSNGALEKQAADQMLAIGQDTPEFHLYTGKAWLAKGDLEKAVEEFNAAAVARPDFPLVHYFLGRAYLEQRAYARAETEFLKDVEIEPNFPYNYEDLGVLYTQLKQPNKAEQAYRKAIDLDQTLVNSYFDLGKLDRQEGRYIDALVMLDHAVALAPDSASIHYVRGQVLAKLGQSAKAEEEFHTSARLLKSFNDRLQQDPSGDQSADAQQAAQQ